MSGFTFDDIPDQTGRTALVTGANTGIGFHIAEMLAKNGAKVLMGGKAEGGFVEPTVLDVSDRDAAQVREEIFGPVLVAIRWKDESEVIRMANESHYGLAAFVWSRDIGVALRTAHAVEAGWVQVNQGIGQILGQSYGGIKQSGIGRECSLEGMLESFTQRKSVTVNLGIPPPQ